MSQKKRLLYFIIYWIIFSGLIQRYVWENEMVSLFADVLVFYMIFAYYRLMSRRLLQFSLGTMLPYTYGAILLVGVVSAIMHQEGALPVIWGIRNLLRFPVLLVLILTIFNFSDVFRLKRIFYWSMPVCAVLCFVQRWEGNPPDLISGLFLRNTALAMYATLMNLLVMGDYLQHKIDMRWLLLSIACTFIFAIICEIKFLYFVTPVCLYGMYVFMRRLNLSHLIILVLAAFFLIPFMQFIMSFYYPDSYIQNVFDLDVIKEETTHSYINGGEAFNRGTAIVLTNEVLIPDVTERIVGHGLGSGSTSSIFTGKVAARYEALGYQFFAASYILVEFGWTGLLLYVLALLLLSLRFYHFYSQSADSYVKYWAACGLLSAWVSFPFAWYSAVIYTGYYLFYIFWGFCFVVIHDRLLYLKLVRHRRQAEEEVAEIEEA